MSFGDGYGNAQPRPGASLRVLAGLAIALISVVIYMTHSEVNPVTGKRQRIAMSVDQEKALGLQAAPEMAAKMGGAADPAEDSRAAFVAKVGRKVVDQSDASRSPYVGNYHFFLLNDTETVNAFALPGGQVFITRALFDKLDDEAELAGVLGHEVGHVVNRHSAEHMAQTQLGQRLTMAVGVGASGQDNGGRNALMLAAAVNQLTQLRFSRGDETEADTYGLKYMAQAGYDPSAMLDVMKILKSATGGSGGRTPEFMATHPLPETRLREIEQTLKDDYPKGIPPNLTRGQSFGQGQPASRERY